MDFWRQQYVELHARMSDALRQCTDALRLMTSRMEATCRQLDDERSSNAELRGRIAQLELQLLEAQKSAATYRREADAANAQARVSSLVARECQHREATTRHAANADYAQALDDLNAYRSLVNEAVARTTGERVSGDEGFYKLIPAVKDGRLFVRTH